MWRSSLASDSPITSNPRTASAVIAELGAQGSDIIAALLEVPRSWPMMNRDAAIDAEIISAARNAASKLRKGAPFAYAVGTACFRHLNLLVDERVLIPRPETEVLVSEVLDRLGALGAGSWGSAADIGHGPG